MLDKLKTILRSDEGLRLRRYQCSEGKPTIGYGHAHGEIPETCTLEEAEAWLDEDARQAIADAREVCPVFDALTENRQIVLASMAFQMGKKGLSGFQQMLKVVDAGKYAKAAAEMKDSRWYRQTTARAKRLIAMMRAG